MNWLKLSASFELFIYDVVWSTLISDMIISVLRRVLGHLLCYVLERMHGCGSHTMIANIIVVRINNKHQREGCELTRFEVFFVLQIQ